MTNNGAKLDKYNDVGGEKTMDMLSTKKKYLQSFVCGQISYFEISAKMKTHRASKIRLFRRLRWND